MPELLSLFALCILIYGIYAKAIDWGDRTNWIMIVLILGATVETCWRISKSIMEWL